MALPQERPAELQGDRRVAVLDVGSNTARLVLYASSPEGGLRPIAEVKEAPRLGFDTTADGSLSAPAMARGVASMHRFARAIRDWAPPRTVAVATSAVRDAPNGPEFLSRVGRETGLSLRVLTGEEEGRYAYLGVAMAFALRDDVVADLGGGSLQLVATARGRPVRTVSLPLGALRLTRAHLPHDPPRIAEMVRLRSVVQGRLRAVGLRGHARRGRLYVVGGTARALGRLVLADEELPLEHIHGFPLRRRAVARMGERLRRRTVEERRDVPGISSDRADVLPAGAVILEELARYLGAKEMVLSASGIRTGIAAEVSDVRLPAGPESLTWRSVTAAAQVLRFPLERARGLRELSVRLFDRLEPIHRLGAEDRLALSAAAWMHDSGAVIQLGRHAEHSAYLVRHMALDGLGPRPTLLAALALAQHEGDAPSRQFRRSLRPYLDAHDLHSAQLLSVILRIAERAPRSRVRVSGRGRTTAVHARFGGRHGRPERPRPRRLARVLSQVLGAEVVVDGT